LKTYALIILRNAYKFSGLRGVSGYSADTTYVRIISVFSLGTLGYMCLEKITIATGRTKITMITQIAGALTNIILDPISDLRMARAPGHGSEGRRGCHGYRAVCLPDLASAIFYVGKNQDPD
jgi:hypothetical protein